MPQAIFLAEKVGGLLERSEVLLGAMPQSKNKRNMKELDIPVMEELQTLVKAREVRLILGDQLNFGHDWFTSNPDPEITFVLMEVRSETDYARHHIQKVVSFFAAMRLFAMDLHQQGHRVLYLTLDDPRNLHSIPDNLEWICSEAAATQSAWQQPDEYRMDEILAKWSAICDRRGWEWSISDSQHFFTQREALATFFKGKKTYRLETFYRSMRKKHNILMTPAMEPEGGEWNFDASNRQKLPKNHTLPPPKLFQRNVSTLVALVESSGVKTIGRIRADAFPWPLTRAEGLEMLEHFAEELLPLFGDFQDAMTTECWTVYHSRLSFLMNVKLLSPHEVVQTVEQAWRHDAERVHISQAEGFIRQILGWREYMRGVYWAEMPTYETLNFFDHQQPLPSWFWTGKTKMKCLSHSIDQTLEHAYAHHIQRLMVTGNFALLAGVHPDAVDAWYLGVYIDALQWVEITNTRGMSQFADGGIVGSKPYVSSAQYIKKMGPYCGSCHYRAQDKTGASSCPFNSLYWDFHVRHRSKLERNPRIGMAYRTWDKMDPAKQQALLETAAHHLENIESL